MSENSSNCPKPSDKDEDNQQIFPFEMKWKSFCCSTHYLISLSFQRWVGVLCCVVFRLFGFSGAADSTFPGAAAGGSGRLSGPPAGGLEPADPQTASVRHHQRPERDQPHPEGVGQPDQVDVSHEQMRFNETITR